MRKIIKFNLFLIFDFLLIKIIIKHIVSNPVMINYPQINLIK